MTIRDFILISGDHSFLANGSVISVIDQEEETIFCRFLQTLMRIGTKAIKDKRSLEKMDISYLIS